MRNAVVNARGTHQLTDNNTLSTIDYKCTCLASFTKDTADNYQEGLKELYSKIRPGEPFSLDSAENLVTAMFFDPRRYDLAKVGRYKFNKKLALKNRIRNQILAEDVVDPFSGEILGQKGDKVTIEMAEEIQNAAVPFVWIQTEERLVTRIRLLPRWSISSLLPRPYSRCML